MDVRIVFILAALGIVHCKLLNSCSITKSFVNGHNERRLKLAKGKVPGQPPASRMTYIIWDDELATKAENWASRKKYGHNPDKTIPSRRFEVGENIYKYGTTRKDFTFDPEMAMKSWWDEFRDYKYKKMSEEQFESSKQIGHYTQMAWADSTRLGCGVSQYNENSWTYFYVVCNYGSPGNYMGEAPYKTGKGASGHLVCGESDCSRKYGSRC